MDERAYNRIKDFLIEVDGAMGLFGYPGETSLDEVVTLLTDGEPLLGYDIPLLPGVSSDELRPMVRRFFGEVGYVEGG